MTFTLNKTVFYRTKETFFFMNCVILFFTGHPCSTPLHPDYAPTLNLGHSNLSLNKDDAKLRATPKVRLSRFDHVQSGMKRKMKDSPPNEGVKKSRRSVYPNKNVEVLEQPEAVVPAGDVDTSTTCKSLPCRCLIRFCSIR